MNRIHNTVHFSTFRKNKPQMVIVNYFPKAALPRMIYSLNNTSSLQRDVMSVDHKQIREKLINEK